MLGSMIVAESREWFGTPFHHQESIKGRGCDCKGKVVGVFRELGVKDLPDWIDSEDYGVEINNDLTPYLEQICDLVAVDDWQDGDILLMSFFKHRNHLGILDGEHINHAYSPARKVIQTRIDAAWRHRIKSVWRYRGAHV